MSKIQKGTSLKAEEFDKLVKEKLERIAYHIRTGLSITNACRAAGIQPAVFYYWKVNATKGKEPYKKHWAIMEQARYEGEALLAKRVFDAAKTDWRAAITILERRHPEDWSKNENHKVSVEGKIEQKIEASINMNDLSVNERLERLESLRNKAEQIKTGKNED
jgi:hypothetical protein